MFIVKLMDKNQVVIPKKIRTDHKLNKGNQITVLQEGQVIKLLLPSQTTKGSIRTTLDSRGRIVIPAPILKGLEIKKGDLIKLIMPDDNLIRVFPTKTNNYLYTVRLNADYRITMPAQLLQALGSPKELFLTPVPNRPGFLLSTTSAKYSWRCIIKPDRRRTTISKKLLSVMGLKPGNTITLIVNPNPDLTIGDIDDLLGHFGPALIG